MDAREKAEEIIASTTPEEFTELYRAVNREYFRRRRNSLSWEEYLEWRDSRRKSAAVYKKREAGTPSGPCARGEER